MKQYKNKHITFNSSKNKKMKHLLRYRQGGSGLSWKKISFFLTCALMFIIIIIPSVIVMLPHNEVEVTKPLEKEPKQITERDDQEFVEVSIERSETGIVETVPLETYVASVVASEMPIQFEDEALKAQAVAARTYIVNHILQNEANDAFTISDTTEHQVYKNEEELKERWGDQYYVNKEKVNKAVTETENEIITYEQQPITPTFFAMSNGYTENAEDYWGDALPYLKKVESKWEEELPNFTDQTIFSMEEINNNLQIHLSHNETIPITIKRTSSERVKEITFGNEVFTGRDVREKLGLRSNDFTVVQKNDHFIFTTKGYGHGVGMSQYGANEMAKKGIDYKSILFHYYKDVEIHLISESVPTLVMH